MQSARLSRRRQTFAVPSGAVDRLRVGGTYLLRTQGGDHGFKAFPVSLDSGPIVVVVADLGLAITGSDPEPHPRMCRPQYRSNTWHWAFKLHCMPFRSLAYRAERTAWFRDKRTERHRADEVSNAGARIEGHAPGSSNGQYCFFERLCRVNVRAELADLLLQDEAKQVVARAAAAPTNRAMEQELDGIVHLVC